MPKGTKDAGKNARQDVATVPATHSIQGQTSVAMASNTDAAVGDDNSSSQDNQRRTVRTVWDWELPTTAHRDFFDHAAPHTTLPESTSPKDVASLADLNSPYTTSLHTTDTPQLSPRRSLKRKSLVEAVNRPGTKRASVVTNEVNDRAASAGDVSPTSARGDSRSGQSAEQQPSAQTQDDYSSIAAPNRMDLDVIPLQQQQQQQRTTNTNMSSAAVLPSRRVYTIQVGRRIFRLSGSSICSDAPSYFTRYFTERSQQSGGPESNKTLYIDRDPDTFADIALHLQGYHIQPRDSAHFVKLFADAQYFGLPRLTAQLFSSDIHIRVGDQDFQISRELFNKPGDSPNYFTLGFSTYFTGTADISPEHRQQGSLVRPPSIVPSIVVNRSASVFSDLLHILKGYEVHIRSEQHRADLLRDARYFHLKGLEQRLIPHEITYNLARQRSEILLCPEDIRKEGLSIHGDSASQNTQAPSSTGGLIPGWVVYQRPHIDQESHTLIVEIGGHESATLSVGPTATNSLVRMGRLTFYGETLKTINRLFGVITSKSTQTSTQNTQSAGTTPIGSASNARSVPPSPGVAQTHEDRIKIRIGPDADVVVNGRRWVSPDNESDDDEESGRDVETSNPKSLPSWAAPSTDQSYQEGLELVLNRSQWRIRVQPSTSASSSGKPAIDIVLGAVKIDGFSNERARNAARSFLSSKSSSV